MKFLTILAVVFWTVDADFWVEFRARTPGRQSSPPPSSSSASSSRSWWGGQSRRGSGSSSSSSVANFLYHCEGYPPGTRAFVADESRCEPVTSYEDRIDIHLTCNFYSVYRPQFDDQEIHFSDHRRAFEVVIWYVGFKNHDIDHPNFMRADQGDVQNFLGTVQQMGVDTIVPNEAVHTLAQHLAVTNVIVLSAQPERLYAHLAAYATVLYRITHFYDQLYEGTSAQRGQLGETIKALLKKMIDPCALMTDNYRIHVAAQFCGYYCSFLNIAARYYGPASNRCAGLEAGICMQGVCTCFPQELDHPFQGCATTPMQLCNNEVRTRLNLFTR